MAEPRLTVFLPPAQYQALRAHFGPGVDVREVRPIPMPTAKDHANGTALPAARGAKV